MSTQKKSLLIIMLLKEFKMIFKIFGDMSILLAIFSILEIIEINPDIPFVGFELLFFAVIPYLISGMFAYLSYRYELRFKR